MDEKVYMNGNGNANSNRQQLEGVAMSEDNFDSKAVLVSDRISKSFGSIPVLFSVNMEIRAGEVHALIGENGAGKSTLMKILTGFHQPTSGRILFDGRECLLPPNGEG